MKYLRVATIALCLGLMVLPSAAIPFLRYESTDAERRELADFPVLFDGEGEGLNPEFDSDFETWLCDHFALRREAVRLNARMHYRLLHSSTNEEVVPGKADWLYYAPTVPDYTGEGRLTGDELDAMAANLRALAEFYRRHGARVFLAVVPNKSTIYPESMPDRYALRQDGGNIPLLREVCAGLPIVWIDLTEPLAGAARGENPIYYRTDTHWNALGAAIAARTILVAMGREVPDYAVGESVAFNGGDLSRLMGLDGELTESAPSVLPASPLPEADYDQREVARSGNGAGRLLVFRDSFGTAVGPWLANAYRRAELVWRYPLDTDRTIPDDVLLLFCERNLRMYLLPEPLLYDDAELSDDGESVDDEEVLEPVGEDDSFFEDEEAGDDGELFEPLDEDDSFFDEEEDPGDDGEIFEPFDEDDTFFEDDEEDGGEADAAMRRSDDGI